MSSTDDRADVAVHPLHAYATHTAAAIDLTLQDEWMEGVLEYLDLLFSRSVLVAGATIPEHVEPAPVFRP